MESIESIEASTTRNSQLSNWFINTMKSSQLQVKFIWILPRSICVIQILASQLNVFQKEKWRVSEMQISMYHFQHYSFSLHF